MPERRQFPSEAEENDMKALIYNGPSDVDENHDLDPQDRDEGDEDAQPQKEQAQAGQEPPARKRRRRPSTAEPDPNDPSSMWPDLWAEHRCW